MHQKDEVISRNNLSSVQSDRFSENGTQRYRCKSCKKSFQQDYSYQAWTPGMKDKIDEQILNSSGVRDTARVLKINKNTVISH